MLRAYFYIYIYIYSIHASCTHARTHVHARAHVVVALSQLKYLDGVVLATVSLLCPIRVAATHAVHAALCTLKKQCMLTSSSSSFFLFNFYYLIYFIFLFLFSFFLNTRPASLNGDAFKVYCLNNANIAKGGWTLIGKAGVGDWSRLSDDAYFDLILNKDKDVSPDDLLTPDRPIAGQPPPTTHTHTLLNRFFL